MKETPEFIIFYPTLTVASKFARFESNRLKRVVNTTREDGDLHVQHTHH